MAFKEVRIIGLGKSLPRFVPNQMLLDHGNFPSMTVEWMENKIGIKSRYSSRAFPAITSFAPEEGWSNSDLASKAAKAAIECAGIDVNEIDLIIVSTCTPDYPVPSTASIVQSKLGLSQGAVIDIRSACCGSTQAIITALQYLKTGYYKTAVVIGSETGSVFGILDEKDPLYKPKDKVNAAMIGDGAGAIVMRGYDDNVPKDQLPGIEILYTKMNCIGLNREPGMYLPAGGSLYPLTQKVLDQGLHTFQHDYRAVLAHGAELYLSAMKDTFNDTKLGVNDIDVFVPHQANGKIPEYAEKLGLPRERIFHNFDRVGNCANASLPLCLEELYQEDTLADGSLVLLGAAESTKWLYGAILLKWKSLKKGPKDTQTIRTRRVKPQSAIKRAIVAFIFWLIYTVVALRSALAMKKNETKQTTTSSTAPTTSTPTTTTSSSSSTTTPNPTSKKVE